MWSWHHPSLNACVPTYRVEWITPALFVLDHMREFLHAVRYHINLRWYYDCYSPLGAFTCISYTKFPSFPRPEETLSLVLKFVSDPQRGWQNELLFSSPRPNVLWGSRLFSRDPRSRAFCLVLNTNGHVIGHGAMMSLLQQGQLRPGGCQLTSCPGDSTTDHTPETTGFSVRNDWSLPHPGHWTNRHAGKIKADTVAASWDLSCCGFTELCGQHGWYNGTRSPFT